MIAKLAENVNSMGSRLEKKISDIEGNVEKRLTVKFNTVITDRVKNEVDKLKEEIDSEVNAFKDKVENLEKSYAQIVASSDSRAVKESNVNLNVIVKNLPADQRESAKSGLQNKVLCLIKDGLKLMNVNVTNAIRKSVNSDSNKPGIVVVTLENLEQKKLILKSKQVLKHSSRYSNVYIENEIPYEQRINNFNNRTILKALGKDSDFVIKSGRIVRKHNSPIKNTDQPQRSNARQQYGNDNGSFDNDRVNSEWRSVTSGNQRSFGRGRGRGAKGQRRGR